MARWKESTLPLISIHAPPRGATLTQAEVKVLLYISIHAPPRGATFATLPKWTIFQNFNSRPSARGDPAEPAEAPAASRFQFTPLREGRRMSSGAHAPRRHFNSRPSARGDGAGFSGWLRRCISIHAPPRGATFLGFVTKRPRCISIHAPPRGATIVTVLFSSVGWLFQFTPLREGRRQKICNFCKSFVQPLQISMA